MFSRKLVFTMILCISISIFLNQLTIAQDWPQWRGINRDGLILDYTVPYERPESLSPKWSVEIGTGHSTPLVVGDKVYTFSRQNDKEVAACFKLATGEKLWSIGYPAPYTMNNAARAHGKGPKSTPLIQDGNLYTLGITGILSCFDITNGSRKWQKIFSNQFPKDSPLFGTAMSPIIEGDMLIAHVGGHDKGALMAFDKETGDIKWRWDGDGPAYASPVILEIGSVHQVITQSQNFCIGVSAENGELLWSIPFTTDYDQNIITPVIYKDMVIFSGLKKGTTAYKIINQDGKWQPQQVWHNPKISMYMSSPVLSDYLLFGFTPQDSGSFFCIDANTGETRWTSEGKKGRNAAIVRGEYIVFALTDNSQLIAFTDSSSSFDIMAQYKVADTPTWAHPVIMDSQILVKDETKLLCLTMEGLY